MTREEYEKKMAAAAASQNNNIFNRTPEMMLEEFYWGPILEDNAPIKIFTPLFAMLRKVTSGNVNFLWVNPTHEWDALYELMKENYPCSASEPDCVGKEVVNCYEEDGDKEIWLLPYTEDKEEAAKYVLETFDGADWFVDDINVEEDYEALADLALLIRKLSEDHGINFPDVYDDALEAYDSYGLDDEEDEENDNYDDEGDFDDPSD